MGNLVIDNQTFFDKYGRVIDLFNPREEEKIH